MKNTYVYFIREVMGTLAPVKIGVAKNVTVRLKNLQAGNMRKMEIAATIGPLSEKHAYRLERDLHRKFRKHRLRSEWFTGVVLQQLSVITEVQTVGLTRHT